ncbi:hypothetical protein [Rhizobium straminoryzae]|uniref:hypothetical protein n=1 Tax=Rhizobium straminoryzae TaxID=1387186 RepID=UPI00163D910C|nr:hypothetical protein [Rhizobium straminoryzae]
MKSDEAAWAQDGAMTAGVQTLAQTTAPQIHLESVLTEIIVLTENPHALTGI